MQSMVRKRWRAHEAQTIVALSRHLQARSLLTDITRLPPRQQGADRDEANSDASHEHAPPNLSPSFSRVPNLLSVEAAEAAQFGSVRRGWRPFLGKLRGAPGIQKLALKAASYFTTPREIDFHLPRDFNDKYEIAELLGEGAFGRVHRVTSIDTSIDLDLAVKIIPKLRIVNLTDYQALQQEGRMMVLLGGTLNVVHFFGAYEDDENVYLVMEHCVGGDAFARITEKKSDPSVAPDESLVALYMADILHVVRQCHLLRILHGDLKLENFLFADTKEASPLKLTDFGGASFLNDGELLYEVRGTPLYTAPEVLQRTSGYSFPSDMWSCGVILYRLLAGRFPFEGTLLDERILHEDIDFESDPWPQISPQAKDLTKRLLTKDVNARLTAEQALRHPWIVRPSVVHSANVTPALLNGTMVQRLQLYRSLNGFQQAVFAEIARRLPLDSKEDIVVLFSELSRHGRAQVGIDEFAAYVDRSGYRLTTGEAKSFLSRLDLDGDGLIALDEFCAAFLDWSVIQRQSPQRWKAMVDEVFDSLDTDRDGRLQLGDLAPLAPEAPHHSFRNDMHRSFRQANVSGNGAIDRAEFHAMLHLQLRAYEHFATRLQPSKRE